MKKMIVPIWPDAQERFLNGSSQKYDLLEVYLNEDDFNDLLDTDLYSEIHTRFDEFLDKNHNRELTDKVKLRGVHTLVLLYQREIRNNVAYTLRYMIEAAMRYGTGVYWVV